MKILPILIALLLLQPLALAQDPPGKSTAAIFAAAGGTWGLSRFLDVTPSCPCARESVPGFDRWAVDLKSDKANVASHVLLGVAMGLPFLLAGTDEKADFANDSVAFGEAIALTFAVTEVTKRLADRPRPYVYNSTSTAELMESGSYKSFFSGHASASFAVAAAHARRRGANGVVFSFAGTTSLLRVVSGRHFLSDVLTGAAAGTAIGWVVSGLR